jgi:hypothetical protein
VIRVSARISPAPAARRDRRGRSRSRNAGRRHSWLRSIPTGCDFNLYLYNQALTLVGYSGSLGNADEHILTGMQPAGRYYVRIHPSTGYSAADPYTLRVVYR